MEFFLKKIDCFLATRAKKGKYVFNEVIHKKFVLHLVNFFQNTFSRS